MKHNWIQYSWKWLKNMLNTLQHVTTGVSIKFNVVEMTMPYQRTLFQLKTSVIAVFMSTHSRSHNRLEKGFTCYPT